MKKSLLTGNVAFLLALMLVATLGSCGEIKRGEYVKGSATIFCDDGFRKILEEEIEVFEFTYPDSSILPFYVSEQEAIDSLMADATQAAITTRELTKEQIDFLKKKYKRVAKQKCIAVDAVALIVNKENPVSTLSMEEIRQLLTGEISTWQQLAVNDTSKVKLVFDSQSSSTVSYMRSKFLGDRLISDNPNAFAQKNNAEVFDIVKTDRDAIGIISVSWLGDNLENARKVPLKERMEQYANETDTIVSSLTTEVKVLKVSNPTEENDFTVQGYEPYQVYINSGEYPLYRKVYMITTASSSNLMKSFYDFMTGFVGQKIISLTGIMPYNVNRRIVELK